MADDLGLTSKQYANAVSFFYIGYILFQLPGDVFLRKISPPIQVGAAMIVWGTFTVL
jgi:fucose permease